MKKPLPPKEIIRLRKIMRRTRSRRSVIRLMNRLTKSASYYGSLWLKESKEKQNMDGYYYSPDLLKLAEMYYKE